MHALKPYPSYRESGVSWLRQVPDHWEVRRIRSIASVLNGATPSSSNPYYWDGNITWITPQDLGSNGNRYIKTSARKITQAGYESCGAAIAATGALVISTRAPIGHVAVLDSPACVNQGCRLIVPTGTSLSSEYLHYSLLVAKEELKSSGQGTTFAELSADALASFRVPFPPDAEQIAIVRLLDHADRRIQRYIRAKEKLITLLEEQKRAVIHEAVTGRIDVRTGRPYPAYKPCGVEGLGDAPEHWDIVRLSRLIRSGPKNGISPPADEHGALTSFAISAVRNGSVDVRDSDRKTVSRDGVAVGAYNLLADDILLVRGNGNLRLVGRAGLVERDMPGWIYPDLLMRLRLTDRAVPRFVVALLNLPAARSQVESSARTAVGTFKINSQHVRQLLLVLPDIPEQLRILAHVSEQIQPLVQRENQATRSVDLMREYRTRLVADVVTGKLDVREAAATLPEVDPLADDDETNVPLDAAAAESAFDDERKPVEAAD